MVEFVYSFFINYFLLYQIGGEEFYMSVNQKVMKMMMDSMCNSFFYWDIANNSFDVSAPELKDELHMVNIDPISKIINARQVPDEDIIQLERLRDKILYGTTIPIEDTTLSLKFRIKDSLEPNSPFIWHKMFVYFNKDDNGLIYEASISLRRLTETEIMNKEILESFSNDRNPRIFNSRIARLIETFPNENFAFVQFDIKNFKFINENYGDEFGNEILNNIFNTLRYYASKTFIFSRLTADVFMYVTTYKEKQEVLDFIAELEPLVNHYKDVSFRVCFGINYATDLTQQPRFNGDCAAIARFKTKEDAISMYTVYDSSLRENKRHKRDMEDSMRKALANNEFVMYLQPKYHLETKAVEGAEALVRWIRSDGIIVPPMDFIPLAEENGFVKEIDHFIWEKACQTIRWWMDEGLNPIPISVNVSRVHLDSNDFIDILNKLIEKYNIPKRYLELEITETVQSDHTHEAILALKEDGYMLLMDDFGSGYSSLKMINTTPFDILKIDRSFLSEFMVSERGKKIISHTINLSQDIGIDLIAEGVENQSQEEFLLSNGCRYAQGYLFSKPIPLDEFNQKFIIPE